MKNASGDAVKAAAAQEKSAPISEETRRRRCAQSPSSSSVCLSTVAALTVAVSYLWVSPVVGFLTSPSTSSARERGALIHTHSQPQSGHGNSLQIPFGLHQLNGRHYADSKSRVYMAPAAGPGDEKEEWRAILASFQLYKAAYGDLKIPIRFVVPSMKPWPGKFLFVLLKERVVTPLLACCLTHWRRYDSFCFDRSGMGNGAWKEGRTYPIHWQVHRQQ